MIIQIRGTSGSGKSTVMRTVMANLESLYGPASPQYVPGRKRPQTYLFPSWVYVLGHYESPCGGCDTIGSAKAVFDLIQTLLGKSPRPRAILCEGLLLSEDCKWSRQLPGLRAIFLTTPVETCLAHVECRRMASGNDKPLNPQNTTNRVGVIERAREKLLAEGVYCRRAASQQAPGLILNWIRDCV